MPEFEINVCGVQKLMHAIKLDKAIDPNGLPCWVLKKAANELAPALAEIVIHPCPLAYMLRRW